MSAKTKNVGAAWIRQTQDGREYLSVVITNPIGPDFKYSLWPAKEKRSDNSPDYNVSAPADERPTTPAGQNGAFPRPKGAAVPDPAPDFPADDSADIPF